MQTTDAVFRSTIQAACNESDVDSSSLQVDLLQQLDVFTNLASGWTLVSITGFTIHTARYNPLIGSSYLITPIFLKKKRAIIYVKNNDEECFR